VGVATSVHDAAALVAALTSDADRRGCCQPSPEAKAFAETAAKDLAALTRKGSCSASGSPRVRSRPVDDRVLVLAVAHARGEGRQTVTGRRSTVSAVPSRARPEERETAWDCRGTGRWSRRLRSWWVWGSACPVGSYRNGSFTGAPPGAAQFCSWVSATQIAGRDGRDVTGHYCV
jgi:hypothetical protein